MNQFGAKDLQAAAQLLYLLVDFFFDVWGLINFVAEMDVHASLESRVEDPSC
jgi:hypothetical protein